MAQVIRSKPLLQELMHNLDKVGHKGFKLPLVGTLRNVLRDLWAYEAVVDKWPDYKSVILRPDEENVHKFDFLHKNIYCYGQDPDDFGTLINQRNVIPWHKPLFFHAIPEHLIDSVEKVAKSNGGLIENRHGANSYIICMEVKDMAEALEAGHKALPLCKLPAGFSVGKLRPEHAELILNNWTYAKVYCGDDPALLHSMKKHFQHCLAHAPSACVYNERKEPISWQIGHLNGSNGLGNTLEEYKSRSLFNFTAIYMFEQYVEHNWTLFGYIMVDNKAGQSVSTTWGGNCVGHVGHLFYHPTIVESKL